MMNKLLVPLLLGFVTTCTYSAFAANQKSDTAVQQEMMQQQKAEQREMKQDMKREQMQMKQDCMKSGKSEDECAQMWKKVKEQKQNMKQGMSESKSQKGKNK